MGTTMEQQEKTGWSVRALAHLLGIPGSTASYWVNSGLVTAERRGRGRAGHTIGLQGLREMVAVMELRGAGISLQAVQLAVHDLRRLTSEERPFSQLMVVAIGDDVVWHEGGDPAALVSAHRQPGQRILIVPVGEATAELQRRLGTESVEVGSRIMGEMSGAVVDETLGLQ